MSFLSPIVDETERLEALRALEILGTPPEGDFDRLARTAARLFDVPVAGIALVDAERQWIKAIVGAPGGEVPRAGSLCDVAVRQGAGVLAVPDVRLDARFEAHAESGVRFYAAYVLQDPAGLPLGTLFLVSDRVRAFTEADAAALEDLGELAANLIRRTYGQRRQQRAIERQTALLQLLEVTAVTANEAATVEEAIRLSLARICALTGWRVGHFWTAQATSSGPQALPTGCWHFEDPDRDARMRLDAGLTAHHDEAHLVKRVLATGQPAFLALDPDEWPAGPAIARSGMAGGIACPVVSGEGVTGVLTFFTDQDAQPDAGFLDSLYHVGAQLGQVVERANADRRMRESEDRYRRLVEVAPDAVLVHREGQIVYANRAAVSLFGARRPEDLLGMPVLERVAEVDRELVRMRIVRSVSEGHTPSGTELLMRLDGSVFDAEVRALPFISQGESSVLAIIRDVTERRRVERLQSEFISIVSHELRTPINTLMGALDLLSSRMIADFPPQAQRMLDIAVNNVGRLKRLVNDMLDIQLLEWGHLPLMPVVADASDLLYQARDAMQPLADQREVVLELTPLLAPVSVDTDRMAQVFANLIGNALKYTASGGRVWLGARVEGAEVIFEVGDTGRGIPPEHLATIFEKFQQVAPGEARERGGAGLGLAIARGLVERHGGRIWAESTPGVGSRFYVSVPLADDEGSPA